MAWWQPGARSASDGLSNRKRRFHVLGYLQSYRERCCFGCNDGAAAAVAVDLAGDRWNDGGDDGRRATSPSSPGSHCVGAWSPLTTVAPSGYASALLDAGMPEEDCRLFLLLYIAPRVNSLSFLYQVRFLQDLFLSFCF